MSSFSSALKPLYVESCRASHGKLSWNEGAGLLLEIGEDVLGVISTVSFGSEFWQS